MLPNQSRTNREGFEEEGVPGGDRRADEALELLKEIREALAAINRDLKGGRSHA